MNRFQRRMVFDLPYDRKKSMQVLSWREVDFAGVVLAGLIGGYVMAAAGLWAGKIPGLVAFDIADFGRRYIVSDRPSAWYFGLASHLANSIILVLIWATLIEPNLSWLRPIEGLLWGVVLAFTLSGALVAPCRALDSWAGTPAVRASP